MHLTEYTEGLLTISLANPDKANALGAVMLQGLVDEFTRAATLPDLRAVILTGQGRVFSAGADLAEAKTGLALSPLWEKLSGAVAALPCLTVAALNGTMAGGACGMALACDLRIAVPTANIFYPVMKLGFLPQPGDVRRMQHLIGPARAKMILMAGQKISAPEALSWGLIDRLAEPDDLLAVARALCADALGASPAHVAAIKALIAAQGQA